MYSMIKIFTYSWWTNLHCHHQLKKWNITQTQKPLSWPLPNSPLQSNMTLTSIYRSVLPDFSLWVNRITCYEFYSVWLFWLNIIFVKFIHVMCNFSDLVFYNIPLVDYILIQISIWLFTFELLPVWGQNK